MTTNISQSNLSADATPAAAETTKPKAKLGSLKMIWNHAKLYPKQIVAATISLTIAASATAAIPLGFRQVIDKGFIASGGDVSKYFEILFFIVVVLGISTAFRFYFVSWLGERVVADIRASVQKNQIGRAHV